MFSFLLYLFFLLTYFISFILSIRYSNIVVHSDVPGWALSYILTTPWTFSRISTVFLASTNEPQDSTGKRVIVCKRSTDPCCGWIPLPLGCAAYAPRWYLLDTTSDTPWVSDVTGHVTHAPKEGKGDGLRRRRRPYWRCKGHTLYSNHTGVCQILSGPTLMRKCDSKPRYQIRFSLCWTLNQF
jgi:hypothetical protein